MSYDSFWSHPFQLSEPILLVGFGMLTLFVAMLVRARAREVRLETSASTGAPVTSGSRPPRDRA